MKKLQIFLIAITAFFACQQTSEKSNQDSVSKTDTNKIKKILVDTPWTSATFSEWGYFFSFKNNNIVNINYNLSCPPMGLDVPQSEVDAYRAKDRNLVGHYIIKDNNIEIFLNDEKVTCVLANDKSSISHVDTSFRQDILNLKYPMLIPLNKRGEKGSEFTNFKNYILVNHF